MTDTRALMEQAHQGDKKARDLLIEENVGLIWSIARRFKNRGVELEDLFQIGSIGLIKAVDKFDCSYDVQLSTYAVPMIMGEIKRYLRDNSMLKVSRGLKELAYKIYMTREQMENSLGREPDVEELSKELEVPAEDIVEALEAARDVESLQMIIYSGDGNDISLMERLEDKEDKNEHLLNRMVVERMMGYLDEKERRLVDMRYFQDMTQAAIAKEMGMSQVQVSRMEKKILHFLRGKL